MKTIFVALLLSTGTMAPVLAYTVYDIDYEPPTYTNGQPISGAGTISDSIYGFTSQALLIQDGGGISYLATDPFITGTHLVSWNFAIPTFQGSSQIISGQLGGDGSSPFSFDTTVAGDGSGLRLEYGYGFPQRPSISINAGQSYSFQVLMNLDADYYSFWFDGTLLEDTVSIPADANLWAVGFGQNQTLGLQAGLDNFHWEATGIPEPDTISLLLLGLPLLCFVRHRLKA